VMLSIGFAVNGCGLQSIVLLLSVLCLCVCVSWSLDASCVCTPASLKCVVVTLPWPALDSQAWRTDGWMDGRMASGWKEGVGGWRMKRVEKKRWETIRKVKGKEQERRKGKK
jgi:hypothetical protein